MPQVIAFAILAHREPEMLRRLVAELAGHPIVVHVDASTDIEPFESIPGIRLVKDRVDINWGGFAMVEATLRLYRDCLEELGDEQNASVALLSGSDFPVRPLAEFQDYVDTAPWSEHIRAVSLLDSDRFQVNRLLKRWMFDEIRPGLPGWRRKRNAILRRTVAFWLPRRRVKSFEGLTPALSSQWTLLSRACLEDLLPTANDPAFQKLFRRTFAPDEFFFATLVHSSPWGARTQYGGLEPQGDKLTTEFPNFHFVDPSVAVWLDASWARKVHESGAYFARKLHYEDLDPFLEALAQVRRSAARSALD